MSEMDFGQEILGELRRGEVTREMKLALAQGLLPLEQSDLIQILIQLSSDPDESVAQPAQQSLADMPDTVFVGLAEVRRDAELLHLVARARMSSPEVLKSLVLNKSAEDQTIEMIARNTGIDDVLALIANNQERLLRHPVLFDILLENMGLSPYRRQQLLTYKEELIERGHYTGAVPAPPEAPAAEQPAAAAEPAKVPAAFDLDLIADFEVGEGGPFSADQMVPFQKYVGRGEQSPEEREGSIYQLLGNMSPKEKLRMALFGSSEVRNILIKDGDRKVATSVLKNPKLQESDVERYAKMRNVNGEVLNEISRNRMWTKNYGIMHALVANPRTPLPVAMTLFHNLRDQHLKMMQRSKDLPQALRTAISQKLAKKMSGGGGAKFGGH